MTLLGTGSAVPTGDRYQASLVVESPTDSDPLLVDCGAGAIHRIVQTGYDLVDIDTVLLTHHHLDHVADVPSLLKARWILDAPEATVVGPPGTEEYLSPLLTMDQLTSHVDVQIEEQSRSPFTVKGFQVASCDTAHSTPGFAYRIDDLFTFSGDTEASDRIAEFADGSRVVVHDCAYVDEERSNHATPKKLGQTFAGVDVEQLYLTHLYPDAAASAEEMRRTVSEYVDADVYVAADREMISIPESE